VRRSRPSPASFSSDWPAQPCYDPVAEKIRLLALATISAMAGRSQRHIAVEVDVDHSAISDLLAGRAWPDSLTVARLEVGLDQGLWPPHQPAQL
jgi:hypothetical protein